VVVVVEVVVVDVFVVEVEVVVVDATEDGSVVAEAAPLAVGPPVHPEVTMTSATIGRTLRIESI
jgi:hypothetical protein